MGVPRRRDDQYELDGVRINYGTRNDPAIVTFDDQIELVGDPPQTPFSQPGDSVAGPSSVDGPTRNCITDASPTAGTDFPCNGIRFTVSVPDGCSEGRCGLIFDIHGSTGNAEQQESITQMRERGRHARPPYIVVQPNGNGNPSGWSRGDDDHILDFMRQAIEAWTVDETRVHLGGSSAGGFLTWRLVFSPRGCGDIGFDTGEVVFRFYVDHPRR